jgi:hypothetical protein
MKINEQKTKPRTSIGSKQARRYTGKNEKVTPKLNETETGRSRGKKQRRQFKLAPNRG